MNKKIKFLKSHIDNTQNYPEIKYTISDLVDNDIISFEDLSLSRNTLYTYIEERAKKRFNNFTFRNNQKETICEIIYAFFNKKDNFVLQAPTGSGKSIIALLVADVLQYYFNLKGYILVSDLSLLRQYSRDIIKYFNDFSILEGQNNYLCDENGMPFNMGFCKLNGYNGYQAIESNFICAETCPYIKARKEAINANVSLMTYQGWFSQRNYVVGLMGVEEQTLLYPFHQRDFIICDEAHKITEIFQQQFAPIINYNDIKKIKYIVNNINNKTPKYIDMNENVFIALIKNMLNSNNNETIFNSLLEYKNKLNEINESISDLVLTFKKTKKLNKDARGLLGDCMWLTEYSQKLNEYIKIINISGIQNMIKNKINEDSVVLNCLDEELIMKEHFHKRIGNCLYMSATIGEINNYVKNIYTNNVAYLNLPTSFDLSRSPIYYSNRYKLSYNKKEENLPNIINTVEYILNSRKDFKGIIQTGSYEFAKYLVDNVSKDNKNRIILYEDSNDKKIKLEEFEDSKNKVLIGPSLIEGIDLKDDLCRFIIIMKIPYPSLGDKFIAKKFEMDKEWYMWKTVNSILQGVGRGVRNENDWCETYIIDGTFDNLLMNYRNLIPIDFSNRIINISEYI